jgi:hypothetical protein
LQEETMNKRIVSVLALLALLPAALQAQSAEERIEAAKVRAQSAGIPVSLLESKVAEGKAKGVSLDRIAVVVERRAANLARAQATMLRDGDALSEADLAAGADALGSGVSEAVLQTISESAPQERRAVAITALTELVARGQVPEEALQRVTEALARGPEALANLPAHAAEARERRGAPAEDGGRPAGVGAARGTQAGPPAAVPTPGARPGAGNPAGAGKPGTGKPGGGRPGGN